MDILETIRVQRDGGRGHHLINKATFDPARHVTCDDAGKALADDGPIVIPDDWRTLHHNKKIALAEKILGADLASNDGETKTAAAERVIEEEIAKRAGA